MSIPDGSRRQKSARPLRVLWTLVLITAIVSLAYGILYLAGGPLRMPVVSEIFSAELSPDGRSIAAGDSSGEVHIWRVPLKLPTSVSKDFDLAGEAPWDATTLSGMDGPVIEVGYSPDGATLTTITGKGQVRLWSTDSGTVVGAFGLDGAPFVDADLAANGQVLASVGTDGRVWVWDAQTGQRTLSPAVAQASVVAINGDGTLVAAGDGIAVQIWDVSSGQLVQTLDSYCDDEVSTSKDACDQADADWLGHTKAVTAVAFSPDGEILATGGGDTSVVFWELESGEARWSSVGHWAAVSALRFTEDGVDLLSGGRDFKIRTIRVAGGKTTASFEGHLSTVNAVLWGQQEGIIFSASNDGTLRAWETGNQYAVHLEWARLGMQPIWGKTLAYWMLVSGVLGLLCWWGLTRMKRWAHLLGLGMYLLGPVVVLGLPLLEALTYPLQFVHKIQIAWPLMILLVWYVIILVFLTRQTVELRYQAPGSDTLSEQLTMSRQTVRTRTGIYGLAVWLALLVFLFSILRRFNLDISFMGSFLRFIMLGSGITFYVSALSIVLAVILALLGALGRLSKSPIASGVSGFYISLIRGTPLLVQIYIWYLGLPRLDIVLPATVAGILALGVNYGAYMTEVFRAGIQAVSIGQREAAQALGMSSGQTFRRIIIPQAFRIVIPPIGNEFIAMMKDSSLVSVMAVQELTWRANKIGRQYFRGMETFIIAAAFYWILTVIFQLLQGRLEGYMARSERR